MELSQELPHPSDDVVRPITPNAAFEVTHMGETHSVHPEEDTRSIDQHFITAPEPHRNTTVAGQKFATKQAMSLEYAPEHGEQEASPEPEPVKKTPKVTKPVQPRKRKANVEEEEDDDEEGDDGKKTSTKHGEIKKVDIPFAKEHPMEYIAMRVLRLARGGTFKRIEEDKPWCDAHPDMFRQCCKLVMELITDEADVSTTATPFEDLKEKVNDLNGGKSQFRATFGGTMYMLSVFFRDPFHFVVDTEKELQRVLDDLGQAWADNTYITDERKRAKHLPTFANKNEAFIEMALKQWGRINANIQRFEKIFLHAPEDVLSARVTNWDELMDKSIPTLISWPTIGQHAQNNKDKVWVQPEKEKTEKKPRMSKKQKEQAVVKKSKKQQKAAVYEDSDRDEMEEEDDDVEAEAPPPTKVKKVHRNGASGASSASGVNKKPMPREPRREVREAREMREVWGPPSDEDEVESRNGGGYVHEHQALPTLTLTLTPANIAFFASLQKQYGGSATVKLPFTLAMQ